VVIDSPQFTLTLKAIIYSILCLYNMHKYVADCKPDLGIPDFTLPSAAQSNKIWVDPKTSYAIYPVSTL